jgi:putative YhdH/YhfP family quinone oxidoreductase
MVLMVLKNPNQTYCLLVEKNESTGNISRRVTTLPPVELPSADVQVRVSYSSLNYKDALCATGHPGVAASLPMVPGIDAAGVVLTSRDANFQVGDEVLIAHAEFGTSVFGGFSQVVNVPGSWVYALPSGLTARDAMILGTAGFTAAQSIDQLVRHGVTPDSGEIVVTGATGGVGIIAVKLLSQLGFQVVAVTGKKDRVDWLKRAGAGEVISRDKVDENSKSPLLKGRWAGAVDSVGGNTLATILRMTQPHGCVTACGLVGGTEIQMTVYPFILRGVTLAGIDSAGISREYRAGIWEKLAGPWAVDRLDEVAQEVDLEGLDRAIDQILAGQIAGRTVVRL